jgi:hypothetical protein
VRTDDVWWSRSDRITESPAADDDDDDDDDDDRVQLFHYDSRHLEQKEIPAVMTSDFCRMEISLTWKVEAVDGSECSVSRSTSFYPQNKKLKI